MTSEGDIEVTLAIEAAQSIETSAVQIVEKLRRFGAVIFSEANEFIKTIAMAVIELFLILHGHGNQQSSLDGAIEVY